MLGHHLAIAAQIRNYEVVIIHRPSSDLNKIADLKYESRIADLSDRGSLIKANTRYAGAPWESNSLSPSRWFCCC